MTIRFTGNRSGGQGCLGADALHALCVHKRHRQGLVRKSWAKKPRYLLSVQSQPRLIVSQLAPPPREAGLCVTGFPFTHAGAGRLCFPDRAKVGRGLEQQRFNNAQVGRAVPCSSQNGPLGQQHQSPEILLEIQILRPHCIRSAAGRPPSICQKAAQEVRMPFKC